MGTIRHGRLGLTAVLGGLALAAPAHAAGTSTLNVGAQKDRSCIAKLASRDARGVVQRYETAKALSYFEARLSARSGDWDVAVFDRGSGRRIAGGAGFGAREVAGGFVRRGQRLAVQACRIDSAAARARLETRFSPVARRKERLRMVRVAAPLGNEAARLQELGIDLTEHGGPGFVDVLLHGDADERLVRAAGFDFKVLIHDLDAASKQALTQKSAGYGQRSALPSGRTSYRTLEDYEADMKRLVAENPGLVRAITLPEPSLEGRSVQGIEIATGVDRADDGRPVFAQMGVHHAREWPSSEHAMEWAFELVDGYRQGNAEVRRLVENVRTIVVPVVNVDGFNLSVNRTRVGTGTATHEYKRKNCRAQTEQAQQTPCASRPASHGVDPNRNYSGLWGGVGASTSFTSETYRGTDGFSEPETRNVQWLVSTRHVTGLITNHTHGGLVLRPPGVAAQGWSPDEAAMKTLGDRMATRNGYTSQYGWQLYDTNGTTEDWTYNATGGYGYTFEIGTGGNFHLAYQDHVINEYIGAGNARGAGKGGNRAAYFDIMETVADPAHHGVLTGRTQPNRVLELTKSFTTFSAPVLDTTGRPGAVRSYADRLETQLRVGKSRTFEWHVNPSTRPAVRGGRYAQGEPTPDFALAPGSVPTVPSIGTTTSLSYRDFPFTVQPGQDNGYMRARIDWTATGDNWDLEFYRVNDDDSLTQLGKSINSNAVRPFEELQHVHVGPGRYVVRVRNVLALNQPTGWSGTVEFEPPEPPEAYTLTCRDSEGAVVRVSQVYVGRGEQLDIGDPCGPPKKD